MKRATSVLIPALVVFALSLDAFGQSVQVVAGGGSAACNSSSDGQSVGINVNNNQTQFDTSGANLLVVAVGADVSQSPTLRITRTVNGTPATETWIPVFTTPPNAAGIVSQIFYTQPTLVGPNTVFLFDSPQQYMIHPSMCAMALSGWNQMAPTLFGSNTATSGTAQYIALPEALMTNNAQGVLVVSSLALDIEAGLGGPFDIGIYTSFHANQSTALSMYWKNDSGATENTPWTFYPEPPHVALTTVVFEPGNAQPMPVLSFIGPPSNTTPGMGFNPPVVVHSNPPITSGNATLSVASPPCGITLAPNTAAFNSSGDATFSSTVANGTGTGCQLIGHAPGATDTPPSNVFQVTTAPTLTWMTQPTNTVSGMVITPAPVVTTSPAAADQIGVEAELPCALGALSNSTVTALPNGQATFSNLIIQATTTPPIICRLKSFNNTHPALTFFSAPFDVTGNVVLSTLTFPLEGFWLNVNPTVYADGIFFPTVTVNSSNPAFSGTITLSVGNCLGVSVSGNTATASAGSASFPDLRAIPSTDVYGCVLEANAPGHSAGFSNTFWALPYPAPPRPLQFTVQPQTSPTGVAMSPAIKVQALASFASRVFLPRSGNITLSEYGGPCGVTFSSLVAPMDASGTATFDMVVPSGTGANCKFQANSPGFQMTVSDAFNITTGGPMVGRMQVPSRMRPH